MINYPARPAETGRVESILRSLRIVQPVHLRARDHNTIHCRCAAPGNKVHRYKHLIAINNKPVQKYCVFNKTRESFLALKVTAADTHLARLKGLLGVRLKSDEGIWMTPSQGVHTIGVRFAIDLVYLDANHRVIETIESFGTFRIAPLRMKCASVLELPTRTIYSSQTQVGDELVICSPEEIEQHLRTSDSHEDDPITVQKLKSG